MNRKPLRFFKRLFRVQYRLAVFTDTSCEAENTYALKKSILVKKANALHVPYWTLYKRGPFFTKERPIKIGGYML